LRTVPSDRPSPRAMRETGAPSAAARRVSSSRGVSGHSSAARASAASCGSMYRAPAATCRTTAARRAPGPSVPGKPPPPAARGEPRAGRVLAEEAAHPGGHRAAQVAGAAVRGDDHQPAAGQVAGEALGGGQAVQPRHVDVEDGHVRLERQGPLDGLVAAADVAHALDAVLGLQQQDQRAPAQLVGVGQQHPDHDAPSAGPVTPSAVTGSAVTGSAVTGSAVTGSAAAGSAGTEAATRNVPSPAGPALNSPPAAPIRSARPASPLPASPGTRRPAPSLTISTWTRPPSARTVISHHVALEWRSTLVAASRATRPSGSWTWAGSDCGISGRSQRIPAARSTADMPSSSVRRDVAR